MREIKLKTFLIAACCFIVALCSQSQGAENAENIDRIRGDRLSNCSSLLEALDVVRNVNDELGIQEAVGTANFMTDFVVGGDDVDDIEEVIEELQNIHQTAFNQIIQELMNHQN